MSTHLDFQRFRKEGFKNSYSTHNCGHVRTVVALLALVLILVVGVFDTVLEVQKTLKIVLTSSENLQTSSSKFGSSIEHC